MLKVTKQRSCFWWDTKYSFFCQPKSESSEVCVCFAVKLWSTNLDNSVASIEAKANVCCVKFSPTSRYHLAFGCAGTTHLFDVAGSQWVACITFSESSCCWGGKKKRWFCAFRLFQWIFICGPPPFIFPNISMNFSIFLRTLTSP